MLVRGAPARDAAEARTRVEEVETRLRDGEPFATVQRALGDSQVAPVPFDDLPSQKLREYLGPAATRAVLALEPGGVTSPLRSGTGWQVMELVDRVPGFTPPLAEIEKEVRAELVRRAGDDALRDYLEELRLRADVRIGHTPP